MRMIHWLLVPLCLLVAGGLGYTVLSLPDHTDGLQKIAENKMDVSGVSNPVTAVLLNFRAYDTFLEMAVLLLALMGVRSLGSAASLSRTAPGPVLDNLARFLVPVLIMVAAYLLWVGAHAPGGAFQAGSVLGAAGVLLLLAGWRLSPSLAGLPLRLTLVAGLGAFVAVAALTQFMTGQVLQYPVDQAGTFIFILETVAAISIGVTIAALFLGGAPEHKENQ